MARTRRSGFFCKAERWHSCSLICGGRQKKMLEEQTRQTATLESMLSKENITAAWLSVKANGGAAGVDGKSIRQTGELLQKHWESIRSKLLAGTYRPSAVRLKDIPKAGGGTRTLGIPTVLDRMIQQAIHQRLSPLWETEFSEHSHGFRPNRSAHDAIREGQSYIQAGKGWVVDIDLKSFFDEVSHDILMRDVARKVEDKGVLRLIGSYLRATRQAPGGSREKRSRGTPQGGPLSPLLANIYLDPLDKELERRGLSFVRYADDIAIFTSSERSAQRVLESVIRWIEKHLKVPVNRDKSGSGPTDQSSLLGFRLYSDGRIGVAPKSIQRMKARVRALWDAQQNRTSKELRDQWRKFIIGWWNYFKLADGQWEVVDLSGWIRRHIRKCFWLRWSVPRGRRNALKRLGITNRSLGMAWSRKGAWPMARHWVMHQALPNARLEQYGFTVPWMIAKARN